MTDILSHTVYVVLVYGEPRDTAPEVFVFWNQEKATEAFARLSKSFERVTMQAIVIE